MLEHKKTSGVKYGMLSMLLVITLSILPILVNAQANFYAKTDAHEVLTGSYFEVEFILENANGSQFSPPVFNNFRIISGPSQSSQISIINGRRSQKKGYSFTLKAEKPGIFKIGPATIRVRGKVLRTKALSITVLKGKKNPSASMPMDKQIFVVAELSDSTAYPGQQIMLNYRLFTKKRIKGYNFTSNPVYEGFYVREININDRAERRIIDGVEFSSQVLRTIALFPQKLGELRIDPVQITLGIVQRNEAFSFFNTTKSFTVITNENTVVVKPLPSGAPKFFNGALGKFSMSSKISKRRMTTDEAISLQVSIRGNGLSKFIEAPELDLNDKFEVYDPRVLNEDVFVRNDDIESIKTFEYLLVPLKEGRHTVQVEFSYFDTDSSDYVTLHSPEYSIKVSPGRNKRQGLSAEEVLKKYQLKPMMFENRLKKRNEHFFGSQWFWILIGLLLAGIPIMLGVKRYQIKQGKIDPLLIKKKKASKIALKRLSTAQNYLQKNEHTGFYKAVSDALLKYVADKFGIQTLDLSKDNIMKSLKELGVENQLCKEYLSLLQSCEIALFGGTGLQSTRQIFERAKSVIIALEMFIKKK